MAEVSRLQVETALKEYIEPHLKQDLLSAKAVKDIIVNGGEVILNVELGFPAAGFKQALESALEQHLKKIPGVSQVTLNLAWGIKTHSVQKGVKPIKNVKNIIAVASGKGGVGKSTMAVNLALALQAEGAKVGILDADIYGPSQPRMLGATSRPESVDGKSLEPVVRYGVQSMSIGYLIDEETPMIWRGPMVTQALEQLLMDTNWKEIDYLIVDLPPGTGDIQLTLAQKIPVSGAVIVTTPQDIALLDARKALKMFEKVQVSILGIVENMSIHICSQCGHAEHIFGEGGGQKMATDYQVDLLGHLPLDMQIRRDSDAGKPTVEVDKEGRIALLYREIARKLAAKLSLQTRDFSNKFPNIMIQNT